MAEAAKKKIQIPHTYTIIFLLMIVVAILTWIVPSGAFETAEVNGREIVEAYIRFFLILFCKFHAEQCVRQFRFLIRHLAYVM